MVAWQLFALGLFPSYVSVLVVEKHYTSFWTGFWNIYGLFMTSVGLSLDNQNQWWVWGMFAVVVIAAVFIYDEIFGSHNYQSEGAWIEAVLARNFGASWITTSLNWGLYVGFSFGAAYGILAMAIHGIALLLLAAIIE